MKWRLAALAGLIVLQLAVPVWYGGSEMAEDPFLDTQDLADGPTESIGSDVVAYGQVVELDPLLLSHRLDDGRALTVRIDGIERQVERGQYLEVYGTIESGSVVVARRTVVRGEREHWYTYGVSVLGVLFVLGRIARDWHLDLTTWTARPRGEADA